MVGAGCVFVFVGDEEDEAAFGIGGIGDGGGLAGFLGVVTRAVAAEPLVLFAHDLRDNVAAGKGGDEGLTGFELDLVVVAEVFAGVVVVAFGEGSAEGGGGVGGSWPWMHAGAIAGGAVTGVATWRCGVDLGGLAALVVRVAGCGGGVVDDFDFGDGFADFIVAVVLGRFGGIAFDGASVVVFEMPEGVDDDCEVGRAVAAAGFEFVRADAGAADAAVVSAETGGAAGLVQLDAIDDVREVGLVF